MNPFDSGSNQQQKTNEHDENNKKSEKEMTVALTFK